MVYYVVLLHAVILQNKVYIKSQRSRSRVTKTLPLAAYVSHAGFSPLQGPAAHVMLATPGFPCVTSARPLQLSRDINHARVWRLTWTQLATKALPAWVFALLWRLASSSFSLNFQAGNDYGPVAPRSVIVNRQLTQQLSSVVMTTADCVIIRQQQRW